MAEVARSAPEDSKRFFTGGSRFGSTAFGAQESLVKAQDGTFLGWNGQGSAPAGGSVVVQVGGRQVRVSTVRIAGYLADCGTRDYWFLSREKVRVCRWLLARAARGDRGARARAGRWGSVRSRAPPPPPPPPSPGTQALDEVNRRHPRVVEVDPEGDVTYKRYSVCRTPFGSHVSFCAGGGGAQWWTQVRTADDQASVPHRPAPARARSSWRAGRARRS